jgi:hypothetical protein
MKKEVSKGREALLGVAGLNGQSFFGVYFLKSTHQNNIKITKTY